MVSIHFNGLSARNTTDGYLPVSNKEGHKPCRRRRSALARFLGRTRSSEGKTNTLECLLTFVSSRSRSHPPRARASRALPPVCGVDRPRQGKDAKGKGGKGEKEAKGKGKGKAKGGKGKKGGKGGADQDEPPELPPPLQGKSELAAKIFDEVK